jgi:16S rRNA (cytosine967-C5)-methyltransferase
MPRTEGLESRRAALVILNRVLRMGIPVGTASADVREDDKPLALAISGEVLRRLPELDSLIDSATARNLPGDAKARMVLRLALAQKLALTVPDHAIVATALPLVDGGPRRLVHGVLSTLLKRPLKASDAPLLPDDVERRWARAWGTQVVVAARRQILKRPPLDLIFKSQQHADGFVRFLGGVQLAPLHVRVTDPRAVESLPGFEAGDWWIQNLAASIPARLIPARQKSVLDACAAPGGKTLQLGAAGHSVVSVDSSEARLPMLEQNLGRTGMSASIVFADLLDWKGPHSFDAILLDAPCSATGTFRRHPEVLYRASGRIIHEMADKQLRLLRRVSAWLKPRGTLVYSVCSLEPEEGEKNVADFLASHPDFSIDPPHAGELPDFVPVSPEGWLRILPGLLEPEGGLDGFFIARLVRAA